MSSPSVFDNPIATNEAICLRTDVIKGTLELDDETKEFMNYVRDVLHDAATLIKNRAPAKCDIGRIIAGMDALQHAKNVFCEAALIGSENDKRKKRKFDESKN